MGTEGHKQSLGISIEIRTHDQLVIGFAERHGFNAHGERPDDRVMSEDYIRKATEYYHTLERIHNKDYFLPDFNALLIAVTKIAKIEKLSQRVEAIQGYIGTGKLPEGLT